MAEASTTPATNQKKKKAVRSPNFPAFDLETAIKRSTILYKEENKHPAAYAVVVGHWAMTPKSSSALQAVGALNQFGLVKIKGSGDDRRISLSQLGLDIVMDERPDSAERAAAIKKAALLPPIHKELWMKFAGQMPSDPNLKHFLIKDKEFNPNSADAFIAQFKKTVAFAKLTLSDTMVEPADENQTDGEDPFDSSTAPKIKVGDFVQWTNKGQIHFTQPKRVKWVSDDGQWASVDGSDTGLAVAELSIQKPPAPSASPAKEDPKMATQTPPTDEMVPISLMMGPGVVKIVTLPRMTEQAFAMFKSMLEMFKPAIVKPDEPPKPQQ